MPQPCPLPVALFFSSFIPGGTEHQMIELARRLDRQRFQVHLACFHKRGPWLSRVERDNFASIAEFPIEGFCRLSTLRQARIFSRWCRETGIAVLHATDIYANIFALPAAAAGGVRVRVANRRELNPDKSVALIALQRASYSAAHRIVANSRAAADRLAHERVPARKITVIPNGIDLSTFTPKPTGDRLRRIVTVANLRKEKAHEVLLEAFIHVLRCHPDAELWIVGGGARFDELTALATQLGIGSRTRFLGHRDDVAALLAESDIFVLPSRSEASPSGIIEAMAAGLPVIATSVGGIVELVQDGGNGVLVPPDEPAKLARALIQLIDSPERAADLARAGRQTIERGYSFDRMVKQFEHVYVTEFHARGAFGTPATQPMPS